MHCTHCYAVLAAVLGIQFCAAQKPESAPQPAANPTVSPSSAMSVLSLSPSSASQTALTPIPVNLSRFALPPGALSVNPPTVHLRPPGAAQLIPTIIRPSAALLSTDTSHQVIPCVDAPAAAR